MLKEERGDVDRFTADQLMVYMILGGGSYTTSFLTQHILSNAKVIEKFFDLKIQFKKQNKVYELSIK